MDLTSNINKNNLFHAYVLAGGASVLASLQEHIANEFGIEVKANPDVLVKERELFGVDDSRAVARFAQMKPLGEKKIIFLSCTSMTTEAQDALLKIFEEPPADTHFFVLLPFVHTLRPTLLSRVRVVQTQIPQSYTGNTNMLATEFLESNYADRLKIIAKIAKDKDKATAIELLNILEQKLYKSSKSDPSQELLHGQEAIMQARKYINDRGAMLKMLLESVAIQLPIIKK